MQKGNPVLKFIRSVPWQFDNIIPDYQFGPTSCALYLRFVVRYQLSDINPLLVIWSISLAACDTTILTQITYRNVLNFLAIVTILGYCWSWLMWLVKISLQSSSKKFNLSLSNYRKIPIMHWRNWAEFVSWLTVLLSSLSGKYWPIWPINSYEPNTTTITTQNIDIEAWRRQADIWNCINPMKISLLIWSWRKMKQITLPRYLKHFWLHRSSHILEFWFSLWQVHCYKFSLPYF